jgi:hypothetical protein
MVEISPHAAELVRRVIESIHRDVEAGAKLLDEKNPGWFKVISMDNIRPFDNPGRKILSQLYIKQCWGKQELGIAECDERGKPMAIKYGFEAEIGSQQAFNRDYYHAWDEQITRRRSEDEVSTRARTRIEDIQ